MPTEPDREFDQLMRAVLGAVPPEDSARIRDDLTASSPRLREHREASLRRSAASLRAYRSMKRAVEFAFALLLILLTLPLQLGIAISIFFFDPPIFFAVDRYCRTGIVGRVLLFNCWYISRAEKMIVKAMKDMEERHEKKISKDPRITPVGHLLRRFALQFLPSLYLVILGRLSLIGPRPIYHLTTYRTIAEADSLASVPPKSGLPGIIPMECLYADADDPSADVALISVERHYAMHASLWLDLRILLGSGMQTLGLSRTTIIRLLQLPSLDRITLENTEQLPFLSLPDEKTLETLARARQMESAIS